jgi:hypothetical protein
MPKLPSSCKCLKVALPTLLVYSPTSKSTGIKDVGKGVSNGKQEASIAGSIAGAHYIRSVAPIYGVPVVLHTDHCAKKLLPWLDGMLDEDEKHFKKHGVPLFR